MTLEIGQYLTAYHQQQKDIKKVSSTINVTQREARSKQRNLKLKTTGQSSTDSFDSDNSKEMEE